MDITQRLGSLPHSGHRLRIQVGVLDRVQLK